jgi:predicted PurR-regulated permease PerM
MTTVTTPTPATTATTVTWQTLRRLRISLLAVTLVLCAAAATLLGVAAHTANTMLASATTAADQIATARQALTEADSAAISSLGSNTAQLTGPGNDYLGEITLASQSLEQVAEVNEAGAAGSQSLRLIGSLISTYSGMIEQANADYAGSQPELGLAEVWYASDFMHMPQSGILAELSTLEQAEQDGLRADDSSFWTSPWTVPLWGVPAILLLVLLIRTQRYLSRRFQRTINPLLALSSLLVLLMLIVGPLFALSADDTLARSVEGLRSITQDRDNQIHTLDTGQNQLATLLGGYCSTPSAGCQATIDTVRGNARATTSGGTSQTARQQPKLAADANQVATIGDQQSWAATADLSLAIGLGVGALLIVVGILLGMRKPIGEYRYQA